MKSIQEDSNKFRVTCNYNTEGVVYRDYLQVATHQLNILTATNLDSCILVERINIRGQGCEIARRILPKADGTWHYKVILIIPLHEVVNLSPLGAYVAMVQMKIILVFMSVSIQLTGVPLLCHRGTKEQRSHSGIQSVPDFRMTSGLAAMLKESLQSIFYWS